MARRRAYRAEKEAVRVLTPALEDCVTSTPMRVNFTAAGFGAFLGLPTSTVSELLQLCRTAAGLGLTEFTIGTWQRGAGSVWTILSWPQMGYPNIGDELLLSHRAMSLVKEVIMPVLRNVETEFGAAVVKNRRMNRTQISGMKNELEGYGIIVMRFREDLKRITPMTLRRSGKSLDGILKTTYDQIETARDFLAAI